MASKYRDQQKRAAMEMLAIGDSVALVHDTTGIPERTLRRWGRKVRRGSNGQMAEKTFAAANGQRPNEPDRAFTQSAVNKLDSETAHSTDEMSGDDYEDYAYIREKLMQYARGLAGDLRPEEVDGNRRTLALSRILDRIRLLDQILPDQTSENVKRAEFYYDGGVHDRPPWRNESRDEPRRAQEDDLPGRDELK